MTDYKIIIGADKGPVFVPARYLNRHGLIAGATGTGKSVSAIGLAESLSRIGVPVFITDIKGDLSGIGAPSTGNAAAQIPGWRAESSPLRLLDVFGKRGAPLCTTIAAMGAPLVSRAMGVTDVQAGVIEIAFAVAGDQGLDLNTLADLRAVVNHCVENRDDIGTRYGLITPSSVSAIGRAILRIERAGGASFFRQQPFEAGSLMTVDPLGRGVVSMLDCTELIREPRLYAAVLLTLLDSLGRSLPEVGDGEKPRLALILDEAHLIFDGCPPELLRMIDQTVRLIRSKGVGIFFATQSPTDLPDSVSRQLHLRVQHALRSVTPADGRAVYAAAQSMPRAGTFKNEDVIGQLGKGQAIVSFMDDSGKLTPAQIVNMALPRCRLSPLTDSERAAFMPPVELLTFSPPCAPFARRAEEPAPQDIQRRSDKRHGWIYLNVASFGAALCVPWADFIFPAVAVFPLLGLLYPLPALASLAVIAGLAKGRAQHAQR